MTAAESTQSEVALSRAAYSEMTQRLRLNFAVAVATNLVFVAILVGATVGATWLLVTGHAVPAIVLGGLSVVDVAYAIAERPWKQLLLANNRLALSESVWIAYIETRRALEAGVPRRDYPHILGRAQNLWISRVAIIAQEEFDRVVADLAALNQGTLFAGNAETPGGEEAGAPAAGRDEAEAGDVGGEIVDGLAPPLPSLMSMEMAAKQGGWIAAVEQVARQSSNDPELGRPLKGRLADDDS